MWNISFLSLPLSNKPSNEVIHTLTTPIHPQDSSIIIGIIVEAAKIMF